eukprot:76084_1
MPLGRVTKLAILSRVITWSIGAIAHMYIGNYVHNLELHHPDSISSNASFLDKVVWYLFGSFAHWDGAHFTQAAEFGYIHVQEHAFFPGLPLIIRGSAEIVSFISGGLLTIRFAIVFCGFLISNVSFVLAARQFYRLGNIVLKNSSLAYSSAVLFCFTPANIFMSSIYTESLWAFISFSAMIQWQRGNFVISASIFSLASCIRSNGVLFCGYFAFHALQHSFRAIRKQAIMKSLLFVWLKDILCCIIVVAPVLEFNFYGYMRYCSNDGTGGELLPFCSNWHPFGIYSYVQKKYWGVGLFSYYQFKQIPNFLLAAPVLYVTGVSLLEYARSGWGRILTAGFLGAKSRSNEKTTEKHVLLKDSLLIYIYYWAVLFVICVTVLHVQVSTRFMSASPALYWFLARAYNKSLLARRWITIWLGIYVVIGPAMFCNFYPWT